jgi:hypothetical protein
VLLVSELRLDWQKYRVFLQVKNLGPFLFLRS